MKDINTLVDKCISLAIEYNKYSHEIIIEPKNTNILFNKMHKKFKQLKSIDGGIEKLYLMLVHENNYVRYTAAIYLLSVDENTAKKVIKELQGISKELDFSIKYLLKEWDAGHLTIY